jgi:uncharacterized damage-inducible protein DinB
MHSQIEPLGFLLDVNSGQFRAALDGIDDLRATRAVGVSRRRIDHVAAHLVDARAYLTRLLGMRPNLDVLDVLEGTTSFDELGDRIPLSALRDTWDRLEQPLHDGLESVQAEALAALVAQPLPIRDPSLRGAVTFLAQHEAYHIGQLVLLRRELGLPAPQGPTTGT